MKGLLRSLLRAAGKGETKVAAVFAFTPDSSHTAVEHLRRGAPELPVWLFSQTKPGPETEPLCARVYVRRSSIALLFEAERRLWPCWVALSVATWTGERGRWPLKLAPFLIPPFRALVLNNHGDFFSGTPLNVLRHSARRIRDGAHSGSRRVLDWAAFLWSVLTYHIWRSGPVTRLREKQAGLVLWVGSAAYRVYLAAASSAADVASDATDARPAAAVVLFSREGPRWHPSSAAPADDLLALFADERTFAVSRQTSFRAWRPTIFPSAPFRALQADEATQVLAPISDTVLVDRRKLAALGISRTPLTESVWMALFWKATTAGWRSYSVGQAGAVTEQPAMAQRETGLLARLHFRQDLRGAPRRELNLARGSIAFAPAFRAPAKDGGRLRVLLVSPFLPYPLSHGGAVRIWNLCRALADRVDFILVTVREKEDFADYRKLHEVFREVYLVDKDERASSDKRLPEQVRHHRSASLRALIADLADARKPDLLQIEYTHMAAFRDAAPGVPAVLVEHDLTFSLYRQLAAKPDAAPSAKREYERWLRFERRWLAAYDAVWTVSEEDRLAAIKESRRDADRTFAIPNGVDVERFVPRDDPTPAPEIFYVGSFRHLPNIIGYEKLRDEVMPRVWSAIPNARLRVVAGPRHEEFWNRFARRRAPADDRIDIRGFVEDLRPLYARASVVVVPLEVSAGTNIKVLEAMACGKAVVSTGVGCAGLGLRDRRDLFIDDDWAGFARSVCELLADRALRSRIAAQARRTVEERFSWTAIARSAYESYRAVRERQPLPYGRGS